MDISTKQYKKLATRPLTDCPACQKPGLAKQISAAGFRLKGGGWYETDFKSGSKKNVAGEADGGSAASKASTGGCGSGACEKSA